MGGNSEVILSHTTNQLHFHKQLLQNFTLDRNIMIHDTTTISSKSGYQRYQYHYPQLLIYDY